MVRDSSPACDSTTLPTCIEHTWHWNSVMAPWTQSSCVCLSRVVISIQTVYLYFDGAKLLFGDCWIAEKTRNRQSPSLVRLCVPVTKPCLRMIWESTTPGIGALEGGRTLWILCFVCAGWLWGTPCRKEGARIWAKPESLKNVKEEITYTELLSEQKINTHYFKLLEITG